MASLRHDIAASGDFDVDIARRFGHGQLAMFTAGFGIHL